jgi:hypothetical protein
MSGWISGELPTTKAHSILHDQGETTTMQFPTVMLIDEYQGNKIMELEEMERKTLAAQIVRMLIQCYGLHQARKVAGDTLNIVTNMDFKAVYELEPTEYSDVYQDPLGSDGTPKKITPWDIVPIVTNCTIQHSHPLTSLLDCCGVVNGIANMRPSEWGYKSWGYEGSYGHRVLILDDLTKQHRDDYFVAKAASGRIKDVRR